MGWTIPVSVSGNGECFHSSSKRLDSQWSPHSLLLHLYCPSSLGINQPERKPNNSPVLSAVVMMISTNIPLVLRFQLAAVLGEVCARNWN